MVAQFFRSGNSLCERQGNSRLLFQNAPAAHADPLTIQCKKLAALEISSHSGNQQSLEKSADWPEKRKAGKTASASKYGGAISFNRRAPFVIHDLSMSGHREETNSLPISRKLLDLPWGLRYHLQRNARRSKSIPPLISPYNMNNNQDRLRQSASSEQDIERIKELGRAYEQMTEQLSRVIIGQSDVIEQVLISLFCRGHVLLVGVPGLAKTLLVSTIAKALHLSFKRIQFTPDLMPSDITGTDVLEEDRTTGKRVFRFVHGPLFSNMVLADEINRTPPKTQAALLEAMQEHKVTIGDQTYQLPEPFFVMATQNPIEQEGTYPLPEAQLDRFMFNVIVDYPSAQEESDIIKQVTGTYQADVQTVLSGDDIIRLQQIVRRVPAADHVVDYARDITRLSRPTDPDAPSFVKEMIAWGAGPRAGINLILAAKARAILHGRFHATTEDVRAASLPVLRHRVLTTFNAESAGVTSDDVVKMLIDQVKPEPSMV
jgi:MoxR-like ATPase